MATPIAIKTEIQIACAPDLEASIKSFSPTLRATMAVAPTLKPIPKVYTREITASVKPTVATATSGLGKWPTKYISTTAKTDSKLNSKIIGIDNKRIAVFTLPCV